MTLHPSVVGIDVSKARLDIFDGQSLSCANTTEAIAPLARGWAERGAFVVLEATGAYDRTLRHALDAADVGFARVNPGRARDFARAAGFLAKLVLGRAQARPGGPTSSTRGCWPRLAQGFVRVPPSRSSPPARSWPACIAAATSSGLTRGWCWSASRSARG